MRTTRRSHPTIGRLVIAAASALMASGLALASVAPAHADEPSEGATTQGERAPAPPAIGGFVIGAGTVSFDVRIGAQTDSEDGGPVETFEAVITRDSTGATQTQQRSTEGRFEFAGLDAGLYHLNPTVYGPGGSAGVSGWAFVIPDTSSAPIIDGYTAERTGVTLTVRNVNDAISSLENPPVRASASYKLTLSDGVNTYERASSAIDGTIGYYNFLTPGTTYEATVTVSYFHEGSGWFGTSEAATTAVTTLPAGPEEGEPGGGSVDPTVDPTAPAPEALTDDVRGGVTVPTTGVIGAQVTVDVGAERAGQTLYGWLYSTPAPLGAAAVDANGKLTFTLPGSIETGAHRIAITDAANNLIGWGDIRLSATRSDEQGSAAGTTELARTGGEVSTAVLSIGVLLVLAGGGALSLARRGIRARGIRPRS